MSSRFRRLFGKRPFTLQAVGMPPGRRVRPRLTVTEIEVLRVIRRVTGERAHANPWLMISVGASLAGFAALLLQCLGQAPSGLLPGALWVASVGYLFARRTSLPTVAANVDATMLQALLASPVLDPSFKQACAAAAIRGELTYQRLLRLAARSWQ